MFQCVSDDKVKRSDHVWFQIGSVWKCCLCGALAKKPPDFPTDDKWMPDYYAALDKREKTLCPPKLDYPSEWMKRHGK